MAGENGRDLLNRDIAAILGKARSSRSGIGYSLVLAGITAALLQPQTAEALSLGELEVRSALGQPLVTTTTARIAGGESIGPDCITSVAAPIGSQSNPAELDVRAPKTSMPGTYPITITSSRPLFEPMYEIRLQVSCPNTVRFARDYVIMLNLPMTSPQTQPRAQQTSKAATAAPTRTPAEQTAPFKPAATDTASKATLPARTDATRTVSESTPETSSPAAPSRPYTERFVTPATPVTAGGEYLVQRGDTLSTIAQRVAGRPRGSTWAVAEQIFRRNDEAFVDGDPNKIKLGSVLFIPTLAELGEPATELTATAVTAPSGAESIAEQPVTATELQTTSAESLETPASNVLVAPAANTTPPAEIPATTQPVPLYTEDFVADPEIVVDVDTLTDAPTIDMSAAQSGESVPDAAPAADTPAPAAVGTPGPESQAKTAGTESGLSPMWLVVLLLLTGGLLLAWPRGRQTLSMLLPGRKASRARSAFTDLDLPHADDDCATDELTPLSADEADGSNDTPDSSAQDEAQERRRPAADAYAALGEESAQPNQSAAARPEQEPAFEETSRFSAPDFSVDGATSLQEASELEGTNTMRKLFSDEAEARRAESGDARIPASAKAEEIDFNLDDTSDLQTLATHADPADPDDPLSATLSDALGLLEQDYQDEYTASQILEQKDLDAMLGESAIRKRS